MATTLGKSDDSGSLAARAAVVRMAQELGVGQWSSRLCPACEGGASHERTLSMDIGANGIIRFNCFRASCDFKGMAYQSGLAVNPEAAQQANRPATRPLADDLHQLSARELKFFESRYGIPPEGSKEHIKRTESRYALSINRPDGSVRGYITRRPYEGSPADTPENRASPSWAVKALTYMDVEEPVQSWYGALPIRTTAVLVEDQLSAIRLVSRRPTITAIALLGTGLNAGKVAEIQRIKPAEVILALDADATGQAFAMARKWGLAFRETRVVVLSKDVKDSTDDEIDQLPI